MKISPEIYGRTAWALARTRAAYKNLSDAVSDLDHNGVKVARRYMADAIACLDEARAVAEESRVLIEAEVEARDAKVKADLAEHSEAVEAAADDLREQGKLPDAETQAEQDRQDRKTVDKQERREWAQLIDREHLKAKKAEAKK